jgi:hypothetical protein
MSDAIINTTSMSDVTSNEEAQETVPDPFKVVITAENFANDDDVRTWARENLAEQVRWTRNQRLSLEEEWVRIREMTLMQHNDERRYFGRSNKYLPVHAKNRQTLVSALSRALFPSDEYIDVAVRGGTGVDPEALAKPVKAYLQWEFDVVAKLRSRMKTFLGQLVDYGTSPMKVLYKKQLVKSEGKAILNQLMGDEPQVQFDKCYYEGLRVTTCDIFNWYVFPNTISSLDEATLIFEDYDVTRAYVEKMGRLGRWSEEDVDRVLHEPIQPDKQRKDITALEAAGGLSESRNQLQGETAEIITLTECWTYAKLPVRAYLPFEDPDDVVPVKVVLDGGGDVVEVIRNPYFHQRPPYVCARSNVMPGVFYGYGAGKTVEPFQLLANDFANQTNDVGQYGLNPVAVMNPSLMMGKPPPLAPGATFYANDVQQALNFLRPDVEQLNYGFQFLQMYTSMGSEYGGAPPIMQGQRGAKTATSTQILQKNAQNPIQDMAEDIENDVMTPMLQMAFKNAQQFREKQVLAAVAGKSIEVSRAQLCIDAELRWMASSQAANNQMRAQQAMQFVPMVASPAIAQSLMAQGKMVNYEPLLRHVWTDGLGYRDFSQFIVPINMAAMMAGQPGQPGAPGQEPQDGGEVRSPNQGGEAQPGEEGDFMDVRAGADQMAAEMGASGGAPEGEF